MAAIQSRVMPALRLRGSLNAVMPLEIASTPVRAVVPLENACRSRNSVTACASLVLERAAGRPPGRASPAKCREKADADRQEHRSAMKK